MLSLSSNAVIRALIVEPVASGCGNSVHSFELLHLQRTCKITMSYVSNLTWAQLSPSVASGVVDVVL